MFASAARSACPCSFARSSSSCARPTRFSFSNAASAADARRAASATASCCAPAPASPAFLSFAAASASIDAICASYSAFVSCSRVSWSSFRVLSAWTTLVNCATFLDNFSCSSGVSLFWSTAGIATPLKRSTSSGARRGGSLAYLRRDRRLQYYTRYDAPAGK